MKWQGQSVKDQRSLGDTVLKFAKAAPLSKVYLLYSDFQAMCSYMENART